MDKTSLGLLDKYVQAIEKSDGGKDLNDTLLNTVKLLLRSIKYSDDTLKDYDEMEIMQLFSFYGKIGQFACDFYQASKDHLDPVALKKEIGQRLETTTEEITRVNASLEKIEKDNAELMEKEEELNEKSEAYKRTEENISRLKKIEGTITEEAFNKLKQEETELNLHLGEDSKIAVKLKEYGISRIDDFSAEMDNLKENVKRELARFDDIIKGVLEELEKEKDDTGKRNKTLQGE